jgi:hypothetical protein
MVLAKSLAKVSSVPPGATPTIIVIDFDGKLCANAEVENSIAATTQNSVRTMICLKIIMYFEVSTAQDENFALRRSIATLT